MPLRYSLIIVCLLFSLSSCVVCTTCTYTNVDYGVVSTYEEEYCGSRYEVRNFESNFKDDANQPGVEADCTRF